MQAKEMASTNHAHPSDESMVSKVAKKVPTYIEEQKSQTHLFSAVYRAGKHTWKG